MDPSRVLVDRTNENNPINKVMNSSHNLSPKARPLPHFYLEQSTFSTKKEKATPKLINPPRPPIKSCPPISRLKPYKKPEKDIPKIISFVNIQDNNKRVLSSPYYDSTKTDLFIEQCFISEGSLGSGSFGKVFRVKSREDGEYYAIKKSKDTFKGLSDRDRKLEEVAKHEELPHHPNCVRFYRAWEEKQRLYIQIELCKTSLSRYAEQHHDIPEPRIWSIIVDLLQALKHLHDRNLVHMDIKPENIFITSEGHCKLGDFGLMIDLKKNDLKEVQEGDPKYLAPEILQNCMNITCAADIFSLGMTILELATDLDLPRSGDLWHTLRSGRIPSDLFKSLSPDLVDLITKMLVPDHLKRASAKDLIRTSKIRYLISSRKKDLYFYIYSICNKWNQFLLTLWYFVLRPAEFIKQRFLNYREVSSLEDQLANGEDILTTHKSSSTPKKVMIPTIILDTDHLLDLKEDESNFNDTMSTNYSYSKALDDDSSFGDLSGFSNHDKSHDMISGVNEKLHRTEPPKKHLKKSNHLDIEQRIPNSSSPCKTPPLRPLSSFYYNADNTPTGVTNKRLIFDDYEDLPRDSYRSMTPSPTDQNFDMLKQKANRFFQELSASPASIGADYDDDSYSSSDTEQISVKLNFKPKKT